METPLFALEIFSGTCCLLSSVFLHFFSYSAKQKDLIYQKGLMYIKLALIIMGVSTLFFAITESFRLLWGIERSGFFNGREKWAKGFENQRV